ncbi:SDR family NAD(P)-dependent oxidoreductase [Labrys wisconsinensis]|uniref:NAD(P)-dependent dehydrogenase (Short-subunit alcohol dehydrogenase family) n=1 Tax=Labrys wisconsinensis TaxID=425677 RepID=A0ABU0J3T2_9HYPH|nr:SDR family NAD(P)-dependent oxidoreductase [Labrys wisconsinensis]MDQ0468073.1 NAD(P)-dependent dehydrogenase (short-subunit alcohol dehydrogenase family) [Labrys wisconsinensis]
MSGAIYPSLKGRTVLITGGGQGIGAATVRRFAEQGAKVGFIDLALEPSRALAEELAAAGLTVHFEHADLTDIAALKAAIGAIRTALGPITLLVNNAAHDQRHKFLEVTPDYFDDRIAVNFKHAFFATQAVIPDMIAAGGGSIVNYGSVSWLIGSADLSAYGSAKAAAHGFTKMLAREFGKDNIRVNCVLPGWIMTERQMALWLDEAGEEALMRNQCLKRKLVPDELAKVVLFLASDESSAITSQTVVVDGGWT